jgi:DNA (cytosine-5)-methyltransferase 1
MLTVADYFCGAGGSSTGMHQVPGVRVVMASNHWKLAVDTHNANFPDADTTAKTSPDRCHTTSWSSAWSASRGRRGNGTERGAP